MCNFFIIKNGRKIFLQISPLSAVDVCSNDTDIKSLTEAWGWRDYSVGKVLTVQKRPCIQIPRTHEKLNTGGMCL